MIHHDRRDQAVAEVQAEEKFQERIGIKLAASRDNNERVMSQIEQLYDHLRDYLVKPGGGKMRVRANGKLLVDVPKAGEHALHVNAIRQIGEKIGAPGSWLVKLSSGSDWQRQLAARVVDEHLSHSDETYMLRSVGNEIRAFLSDRYKRLDTQTVLRKCITSLRETGAQIWRVECKDTQVGVEAVVPRVYRIDTPRNGMECVAFGAVYRTSDFGDGAECVHAAVMRAWCTNLAVSEQILRKVHFGRRVEMMDNVQLSRQSLAAEAALHANIVSDVIVGSLSQESVDRYIKNVQLASSKSLDSDDAVELLDGMGFTDDEIRRVTDLLSENDIEKVPDGPLTRWKLSQAVSWLADNDDLASAKSHDMKKAAGSLVFVEA